MLVFIIISCLLVLRPSLARETPGKLLQPVRNARINWPRESRKALFKINWPLVSRRALFKIYWPLESRKVRCWGFRNSARSLPEPGKLVAYWPHPGQDLGYLDLRMISLSGRFRPWA